MMAIRLTTHSTRISAMPWWRKDDSARHDLISTSRCGGQDQAGPGLLTHGVDIDADHGGELIIPPCFNPLPFRNAGLSLIIVGFILGGSVIAKPDLLTGSTMAISSMGSGSVFCVSGVDR
jgi:hypothetical protein